MLNFHLEEHVAINDRKATTWYACVRQLADSDANPGTEDRPVKSVAKAVSLAQPGDTVVFAAGTYRSLMARACGCGRSGRGTASRDGLQASCRDGKTLLLAAMLSCSYTAGGMLLCPCKEGPSFCGDSAGPSSARVHIMSTREVPLGHMHFH